MKFIFPQNYNFNSKFLGIIEYNVLILNIIWCTFIFCLINIFFNNYPSGIIPVDFYFKSNTTRKIDINFDINIEVL